jgi:hypothetical protein
MTLARQSIVCLAFLAVAIVVSAQPQSLSSSHVPAPMGGQAILPPVPPQPQSPVIFFRELLAMPPMERIHALTNRPPEARARIMAKVHEYQALDPDERELRLRATDLRWYLTPLFRLAPTDRQARLDQVPAELRDLVTSRLTQWDALPPSLQQEFLENDKTLHYFARVDVTNSAPADAEHQKIADQFNQFFELTPGEKAQSLATLSDAERAQMEKTLQSFENLPPRQRLECVRNYARFTGMSAADRADFLKNAERWSQMSPKERQTWRDLVVHVPELPPLPMGTVPANLMPPHQMPKVVRQSIVTN